MPKNEPENYLEEIYKHQKERRKEKESTVFLQAPDVKNGVGGLRDYQGVLWMTKVKFGNRGLDELIKHNFLTEQESKSYSEAYSFLLRVRNELHFLSKRPVDILHLEKQPEVALGLGYKEEDIFKRVENLHGRLLFNARTISQISGILEERMVYANAGNTSKISFRKVLSAYRAAPTQNVDGFDLTESELSSSNPEIFDEDPERILRLFRHAQRLQAKLSPNLSSLVRNRLSLIDSSLINSTSANVTFRSILQEVEMLAQPFAKCMNLECLEDLFQNSVGLPAKYSMICIIDLLLMFMFFIVLPFSMNSSKESDQKLINT